MNKKRSMMVLILLGVLAIGVHVYAQRLCESLVDKALEAAGKNCGILDGTMGCYGYDRLNATFQEATEGSSFDNPGGKIDIPLIHTAETGGLDVEEDEWGIGYFRAKANLATVNSAEAVRIIMLGQVLLENTSDTTASEPMQKLFFTTGGDSDCPEAPNVVVIQGPDNKKVDLLVNEVPIRIGSTIALGLADDDRGNQVMFVTVLSGSVMLYPDTPQQIVMLPGQTSSARLSPQVKTATDTKITATPAPQATVEATALATAEATAETSVAATESGSDTNNGGSAASSNQTAAGTVIINKVTGEPILSPDGTPYVRRVPVERFTRPTFLVDGLPGYRGTGYYKTLYRIPNVLLNYPLIETTADTCSLHPDKTKRRIEGHNGAGYNRGVRAQLSVDLAYIPTGVEYIEQQVWFEIPVSTDVKVWVDGKDFTNVDDCANFIELVLRPREECILEPRIRGVAGHSEPGFNSVVLGLLSNTRTFTPLNRAYVNSKPWFEVEMINGTRVWADGRFFKDITACETEALAIVADVTEIPILVVKPKPSPTPMPQTVQNAGQTTDAGQPQANPGDPSSPPAAAVTPDPAAVTPDPAAVTPDLFPTDTYYYYSAVCDLSIVNDASCPSGKAYDDGCAYHACKP